MNLRILIIAALALVAAPAGAQSGRNRILRDEIAQSHATSVYDLVRSRRPAWLNRQHATSLSGESAELAVFVDGARLESIAELRQVSAVNAEKVEFLSAAQAEFRFGQGSPNGAIVVTSRTAQPQATPQG